MKKVVEFLIVTALCFAVIMGVLAAAILPALIGSTLFGGWGGVIGFFLSLSMLFAVLVIAND